MAQPGQDTRSGSLMNWFWEETAAAPVFNAIRVHSLKSDDPEFSLLGKRLLSPKTQIHRFSDSP